MRNDALLNQLGYTITKSAQAQVQKVIDNTSGFEHVEKHLIALHDTLKSHLSCVALSSSKDYFKIKNEAIGSEMRSEVNEMIERWSKKYKIEIEKAPTKDTYYVKGYK